MIQRVPPVVRKPTPEAAVYSLNWLTATGSGIAVAAVISGLIMGFTPWRMAHVYWKTIVRVRFSLLTIAAMLSIGYLTRYSGLDAAMGLAFARTGRALSVFWHHARLVGRSADRFGHLVECALWEPAKNFSRTNRSALHPDGGREQLWRRDGQDD